MPSAKDHHTDSLTAAPTQDALSNARLPHESAFYAILREYAAITLQHFGGRRAARYLRTRRRHPDRGCRVAEQLSVVDTVHYEVEADITIADTVKPFIVETGTERQLQFARNVLQSRMRLDQPDALIAAYTRQMMSFLLFNPDPAHIVMIGLGGGSLPKFCYRHLPNARITVIEIDERVIAMRKSFCVPQDDARFRVIHDDGVRYVAQLEESIDVILIDAFDAAGVAPSLATSMFYRDISRRLSSDGMLVMNLLGEPHSYAVHLERARKAFGKRTLLVPVTGNDNMLLLAFMSDVVPPAAAQLMLRARYLQSEYQLPFRSYLRHIREGYLLDERGRIAFQ